MTKKLALVTGATSGIGEAVCRLLAGQGIPLIITGRNKASLEALQKELQQQVDVTVVIADLSKQEARQQLIEQIRRLAPDLVINNAGFGLYGDALTHNTSEQMDILEVNGAAVLQLSLEAARTMVSHALKGTIVNVSSAAAFYAMPGMAVYAAAKAFVAQFSEAFDCELASHGVRVLTICPGMVETHFVDRAGGTNESSKSQVASMTPQYVAEQIWRQIHQQNPLKIINWKYRVFMALSRLIPKTWLAKILHRSILQRIHPRKIKNHE